MRTKKKEYQSYDELPATLGVPDVADVLRISRAGAYDLVKTPGFPALHIGTRILIPKEAFLAWIKENTGAPVHSSPF